MQRLGRLQRLIPSRHSALSRTYEGSASQRGGSFFCGQPISTSVRLFRSAHRDKPPLFPQIRSQRLNPTRQNLRRPTPPAATVRSLGRTQLRARRMYMGAGTGVAGRVKRPCIRPVRTRESAAIKPALRAASISAFKLRQQGIASDGPSAPTHPCYGTGKALASRPATPAPAPETNLLAFRTSACTSGKAGIASSHSTMVAAPPHPV